MRLFYIDFLFFNLNFLEVVFPISLIVHSRSSFLFSQWKFFELYDRTCPAIFFVSLSDALFRFTFIVQLRD